MNEFQKPNIITERRNKKQSDNVEEAHMCSNCYVHRLNPSEMSGARGTPKDDWEVKILDNRTVSLTAPQGVTFVEDVDIPVEEIVLAIMETKALQKRVKK